MPAIDWTQHAHLAWYWAGRLKRNGFPAHELYSVALFGVWDAAQRYDPSLGVPFFRFAQRRICGEIWDWIKRNRRRAGTVSIHAVERQIVSVLDLRADRLTFAGHAMTLNQWARQIGIKPAELERRIKRWGKERALSAPAEINQ